MNRNKRSAIVLLAVVVERLTSNPFRSWSADEELVLEAFRRSTNKLTDADPADIAAYLSQFDSQQIRGVLSNVKGIFHEMLFARAENYDGDTVYAELKKKLNHPGADVELLMDGEIIQEVQLKATNSPDYIREHMARYPEIDVFTTKEVSEMVEGVSSSGFSNDELSEVIASVNRELSGVSSLDEIADGVFTAGLVGAAIGAGEMIKRREFSEAEIEKILINTHYHADQVKKIISKSKYKKKIKITHEKKLLGTGGTFIKNIKFFKGKDGLLIHSDNYLEDNLNNFIRFHKKKKNQNFL